MHPSIDWHWFWRWDYCWGVVIIGFFAVAIIMFYWGYPKYIENQRKAQASVHIEETQDKIKELRDVLKTYNVSSVDLSVPVVGIDSSKSIEIAVLLKSFLRKASPDLTFSSSRKSSARVSGKYNWRGYSYLTLCVDDEEVWSGKVWIHEDYLNSIE